MYFPMLRVWNAALYAIRKANIGMDILPGIREYSCSVGVSCGASATITWSNTIAVMASSFSHWSLLSSAGPVGQFVCRVSFGLILIWFSPSVFGDVICDRGFSDPPSVTVSVVAFVGGGLCVL